MQALVIVQDASLREQLVKQCERCRYKVVTVHTSNELLSLMASSLMGIRQPDPFALFIVDSWTKDYHGLRILRGIRASGWLAPAILLVDPLEANRQEELLELQVSIVLTKPVGPEEISAAIQSCLNAGKVPDGRRPTGMSLLYM